MNERIGRLSDGAAVRALAMVGERWLEESGVDAFAAYQTARAKVGPRWDALPAWARGAPKVTKESARFARKMLDALLDGNDPTARAWALEALQEVETPRVQALDPLSLGIIGSTLVAAILAARVKKIGPVEFFEGIPKELANAIKAAIGAVWPGRASSPPDQGPASQKRPSKKGPRAR
jgi:hypothetical protein